MSNEVQSPHAASSRKELWSDAKHRPDNCMLCKSAPEYEVLWAEGMGHAWFCEKHLKEWLKSSVVSCAKEGFSNKNCELNSVKKLDNKEASKKFGDNRNANILDSFLSQITMPEVNKEKKKELEEELRTVGSKPIGLQDAEALAPVNPSGKKLGKEITLEEVLPYFKSFYKSKPYVSLTGGLANNGKTENDIDIFIENTNKDIATEFRIYRMFPDDLRNRIRFIYPTDSTQGKYTNHIDLFDLKLEGRNVKHIELMSAIDERKGIKLLAFSKLLKPEHGRFKGEEYEVDHLIEILNSKPEWYEKKIAVQIKYDGIHVRADHERSGKVIMWTEEGNIINNDKIPTIVSEFKTMCKGRDVAVVGELESWESGKHMARQLTTGIIHSKGIHEKEGSLKFNIFDCLYYN